MEDHAYIYVSDDDTESDTGSAPQWLRLAEWRGVPLTFKVLVSQNPHLVDSGDPGRIAITGDFQAGRARLFEFLDALAARQLFEPQQLADQVATLKSMLNAITPVPRCVKLVVDAPASETPARDDTTTPGDQTVSLSASPDGLPDFGAQQLLAEVSDVDTLTARAMTQLGDLKAAGRTDEMWHMLATKAASSDAVGTPSAVVTTPGNPSTISFSPTGQVLGAKVPRPEAVNAVCIADIVIYSIAILFSVVAIVGSYGSFESSMLVMFFAATIVFYAILITVVVVMMKGSRAARTIFVVMNAIAIPVSAFFTLSFMLPGLVVVVGILSLIVLFRPAAKEYFG